MKKSDEELEKRLVSTNVFLAILVAESEEPKTQVSAKQKELQDLKLKVRCWKFDLYK